MPGIEIKGRSKIANYRHGGRTRKFGGPPARALGRALKPKGVFKKDKSWYESRQKPPQLKKSDKEIKEELRKQARKSGAHSKIIFADEWKHIDPGLQKGLFKKEGGRIGLKKGKKRRAQGPKGKGKSPGRSQSPGRTGRRSWRDRGNYKK
jgi:hypothetical protein